MLDFLLLIMLMGLQLFDPILNGDWLYTLALNADYLTQEEIYMIDMEGPERARPEQGGFRITEEAIMSLETHDCLYRFCFYAEELMDLTRVLDIPTVFITQSRHRFTALEALCLLLARYTSEGDQYDLTILYCRSQAAISEVVNELSFYIDHRRGHLLDLENNRLLSPERLELYAETIFQAGAPMHSIYGFIDCTIRPMCRPVVFQRQAYNGYKKVHALKYQAIKLPDGMTGHIYGPLAGRHNDNYLLAESGFSTWASHHAIRPQTDEDTPPEDRFLQAFGDPAYGNSYHIICPYGGVGPITEEEHQWNKTMSALRMAVEHGFGNVVNLFPFLNVWWKHQVLRSPLGLYYRVATLLANTHNTLWPNQTAQYFECAPPTLEEYFRN